MWDQLFGLTNLAAVIGWAALLFGPRSWRPLVRYAVVGFLCAVYVLLFAALLSGVVDPVRSGPTGSLTDYSVRGLRALFASDGGIVVGWTHYLVFDLFIGCWIADKADQRGVGRLTQVPVLLLTFLAGPAGAAAVVRRTAAAPAGGRGQPTVSPTLRLPRVALE